MNSSKVTWEFNTDTLREIMKSDEVMSAMEAQVPTAVSAMVSAGSKKHPEFTSGYEKPFGWRSSTTPQTRNKVVIYGAWFQYTRGTSNYKKSIVRAGAKAINQPKG